MQLLCEAHSQSSDAANTAADSQKSIGLRKIWKTDARIVNQRITEPPKSVNAITERDAESDDEEDFAETATLEPLWSIPIKAIAAQPMSGLPALHF